MKVAQKELASDPKNRIFIAATKLFVRKGYEAVGVREIVREANVNIAMVNYYYGGKSGILKEIMESAYSKYYEAAKGAGDETMSPEQRTRIFIKNIVKFFDENTEIALVTFNTLPFDMPEILSLKKKWAELNYSVLGSHFRQLSIDLDNPLHNSIYNGFLGSMILSHFQRRYTIEHMKHAHIDEELEETVGKMPKPLPKSFKYDSAFYDQYADMLVDQYYYGVRHAIVKHKERNNVV
jgi:AcrR family transcriptional regulator